MPKRKPRTKLLKGFSTIDESIKLTKESKDYLDKLCSKKIEHPTKKKMLSLSDSIEFIGNHYRTNLKQCKYFSAKEANDDFIKDLRNVSRRLYELLNETLHQDKRVTISRVRSLAVSPNTISNLKKYLDNLQPDLDRAQDWNTKRLFQKIETNQRCFVLDEVRNAFKRYGLRIVHSEVDGKRSDFYECVYIALVHAGDTVGHISKMYDQCKKSKYKESTK